MGKTDEPEQPTVYWHNHIPTIVVDGIIGAAHAGGLHRIVVGEIVFNNAEGATTPALRPTANLVIPFEAVESLLRDLTKFTSAKRDV